LKNALTLPSPVKITGEEMSVSDFKKLALAFKIIRKEK
jgi:hypothetical protein